MGIEDELLLRRELKKKKTVSKIKIVGKREGPLAAFL